MRLVARTGTRLPFGVPGETRDAAPGRHSTVTDLARLRGLSMSRPSVSAVW